MTQPAEDAARRQREPLLQVENVRLGYQVGGETVVAVDDVSFDISPGERLMLLGPSGCGKSTLLKAVAGFLTPMGGRIRLDGREGLTPGPDRAVVFQEFDQLFPWRTVLDNVAYPLRVNGIGKKAAAEYAARFLELMRLTPAANRFPHQLSGGMKQRVAIARAMALEPLMLLMDEPFGALDAQSRNRLQSELKQVAERTDVTILFVTHSIQEAVYVGTRVVVLNGSPSTVVDIVDVEHLNDSADVRFTDCLKHLRSLLTDDGQPATDHAVIE